MRRISFALAVVTAGGFSACRTGNPKSATLDDSLGDSAATTEILADVRVAIKDAGCKGCHGTVDDGGFKQWASDTKITFERLTSEEPPMAERGPNSSFNISTFDVKGVYKAYPEYFRVYFADDASWETWADNIRPDPDMHVKGVGEEQKARFERVRDLMLKLSEQVGNTSSLGCTTKIAPALTDHIQDMASSGWASRLVNGSIKMYGCPTGTVDATQCLDDVSKWPARQELLNPALGVRGARIIQVASIGNTSYWMRSSPDGRFVGNGGPAHIDDLQTKTRFVIPSKSYDPGFFPDNKGWTFHGGGGALFCSNATLKADAQPSANSQTIGGVPWNVVTLDPSSSTNAPYCMSDSGGPTGSTSGGDTISTYQSVASAEGSTSYVVTGSHNTDPGGWRQDNVSFQGELRVYELKNSGNTYDRVSSEAKVFNLPNEGDYSLTPSGTYVVGRVAGKNPGSNSSVQLGIRLRSLANMLQQGDSFSAENDPTMSSICVSGSGSKPMVSLDERFVIYHVYDATSQASNLVLFDLANGGKSYQITKLPSGMRALFPHFLANNMIYFQLQNGSSNETMVIATDAAARIAAQ